MATSTIKNPNEIIDITDYCYFNPELSFNITEPFGGRLYYNKTCNYVFGHIQVENADDDSPSNYVDNQEFLVTLKDDKGNRLTAGRNQTCGLGAAHFGPDEITFTIEPRINMVGDIYSSHSQGLPARFPKYTIFAFLG